MSRSLGSRETKLLYIASIVVAGLLTGIAGCGSSGGSNSNARADLENVVRRGYTTKDPALCKEAATPRYLNQQFGQGTDDPLGTCRLESVLPGNPTAREVDFKTIRISGDRAVVTVALTGGTGDGSVIRAELVREGGRWKFDHDDDIQINRSRFDVASRKDLIARGVTAREATCAVRRLNRLFDTAELERVFITGKTDGLGAALAICLGRRSLVQQLRIAVRKGAPKDIPDELVECISGRIAKSSSTALLRALLAAPDKLTGYFEGVAEAAAKVCASDAGAGLLPEPSSS